MRLRSPHGHALFGAKRHEFVRIWGQPDGRSWGDVVLSEDGAKEQYIRGITPNGEIYTLARSAYLGNSEMCGVCFAPNHPTLFVNIQKPGITLAITGPWETLTKV